jgi:hypothetical protein
MNQTAGMMVPLRDTNCVGPKTRIGTLLTRKVPMKRTVFKIERSAATVKERTGSVD